MLKKVLVVEDSELAHSMYSSLLRKRFGAKTIRALNGVDGFLKLAKKGLPDLILLDIDMPVMNGIQFLERLKEDKRYNRIPVIIVSAAGTEEKIKQCLLLGADGYIIKPFAFDRFYDLIERVWEKRHSAAKK